MDDFLLILKNTPAVLLGILQVKKSCKEGSVLTDYRGRWIGNALILLYWKISLPVNQSARWSRGTF